MAGVTPTCIDDDARLRLPPVPPPQGGGTEKKSQRTAPATDPAGNQAGDPRPDGAATARAVLHCCKWLANGNKFTPPK